MNYTKIIELLSENESAASGLCLVKAIYESRILDDNECEEIYGQSEAYNDNEISRLVQLLSKEQLKELKDTF